MFIHPCERAVVIPLIDEGHGLIPIDNLNALVDDLLFVELNIYRVVHGHNHQLVMNRAPCVYTLSR